MAKLVTSPVFNLFPDLHDVAGEPNGTIDPTIIDQRANRYLSHKGGPRYPTQTPDTEPISEMPKEMPVSQPVVLDEGYFMPDDDAMQYWQTAIDTQGDQQRLQKFGMGLGIL